MSDNLGLELSKVLFAAEPGLLNCDPAATGRATSAVANLMGCILATVLRTKGEEIYMAVIKDVMVRVHNSALATVERSLSVTPSNHRH